MEYTTKETQRKTAHERLLEAQLARKAAEAPKEVEKDNTLEGTKCQKKTKTKKRKAKK